MSRLLFESRAAVLACEAKQALIEKEIELEKLKQQRKPLTDEQAEAAFKAWHYKHGNNTQGIKWVDDLLRSCWKAAIEAAHGITGETK